MLRSVLAPALAGTLFLVPPVRLAQEPEPLTGEQLEQVVLELAQLVEDTYIFPDVAHEIGERLRAELWAGAYEGIGRSTLASRLTSDLRSVNSDRHFSVEPIAPRERELAEDPAEFRRLREEQARRSNYGFQKLEILDDDVGYLDLRGFLPADSAGATAVAAMGFLANADALIIDLRQNGGGHPSMIQLLTSYFFAQPTHLNSFQHRGQEQIDQYWTLPHVPGKKLVDTPLFVLTSARTFSAAEEFTYDLKNLKRATIVGERTGGGANPGDTHQVAGLLRVFIPDGRAINPITKTNWEGTGVEPDLPVKASEALEVALREARKAVAARRAQVSTR